MKHITAFLLISHEEGIFPWQQRLFNNIDVDSSLSLYLQNKIQLYTTLSYNMTWLYLYKTGWNIMSSKLKISLT